MTNPRSKHSLKGSRRFHHVDPATLDDLADFAEWLEALLHNSCDIWEGDGEIFIIDQKQLVERVHGLRIEIYPNEHPPPHFHVNSPNIRAAFAIEDCALIKVSADGRNLRMIQYWHTDAKHKLVHHWNSGRPANCPVGPYRDKP
jgi:hypothetical protein